MKTTLRSKSLLTTLLAIVTLASACKRTTTTAELNLQGATEQARVQLSWEAIPGEQDLFYIEMSVDGGSFASVQTAAGDSNSAVISGLAKGHSYQFRIYGHNDAGDSPSSSAVTVSSL